jgi:hypothetical protein
MKVRVSDLGLIDAVAQKTGGDSHEILRRGFMLAGPDDAGPDHDPECLFDLIDLPEAGTVDWDALGFGCREAFLVGTLKARLRNKKTRAKAGGSEARPGCPAVRISLRMAAARPGRDPVRQHRNPDLAGCSGHADAYGVPE